MSIEDVSPDQVYEKSFKDLLNSPRTLDACKRQGIELSELDPIHEDRIREMIAQREKKRKIPKVLIDIRTQYYEDKRKEKIRLI